MTKQIIDRARESEGLYILDQWVPRSLICSSTLNLEEIVSSITIISKFTM